MEVKLDFDDVLIRPRRSPTASRSAVELEREFKFYHSPKVWNGIPIVAANMSVTGTFEMGKALAKHKMVTCLSKHYTREQLMMFYCNNKDLEDYVFYSLGIRDADIEKLVSFKKGMENRPEPNLCVDVANGYTDHFVKQVAKIREVYPDAIIIAGNVATAGMAQELITHGGVDIVKVGIGPGCVCTTRLVTGVGYPQLSAIQECTSTVHGLKSGERRLGLVCADGGCKNPGDICKAFGSNADFVMLGGMLAGTEECEGEWTHEYPWHRHDGTIECWEDYATCERSFKTEGRKKSLKFYGMSSYIAQDKYSGGRADHRASEGREIEVKYKGGVDDVLKEITGGIRSCCAYIGATCLKDMGKCTEFVRVTRVHNNTEWSF